MVTPEDYAEWLESPVTIAFREMLARHAERQMEGWQSAMDYPDDADLAELNRERVRFKVRRETLSDIATLDYDDFLTWSETE